MTGHQPEEKSTANKLRFFDDDGYRPRAACICVRNDREDQILLISSHRDPSSWIVPGGGVEPNESSLEAAHRELYEEAGVKGRLVRELGVFANEDRKHRTNVFVVHLEEEFDDWEDKRLINRQRSWYSLSQAFDILHRTKPSQLPFLEQFIQTSANRIQLLRLLSSSPVS